MTVASDMKTKEALDALKNEVEALKNNLSEPTEDELKEVTGGTRIRPDGGIPIIHAAAPADPGGELGTPKPCFFPD